MSCGAMDGAASPLTRGRGFDPGMAVVEPSPLVDILVRGPEGLFIWNGPPLPGGELGVKLDRVPCTSAKFSDDGSKLTVTKTDSTFQKCLSPQHKNVVLWKIENGESIYKLFQKNITKVTWPSVCFSSDEAVACRLASNEI
ncbi:hypothetical protein CQW23_14482 [Capsicum baccatum]|uniref:Eukaryotic translation initiation factor 2A n=1 Tax=Capsicum baccatum TaxID=33114 RepID=A0A2G2WJA5_CAPBA|nr:hypothetical protein CQW23_14482 [Capsicum baccatum]